MKTNLRRVALAGSSLVLLLGLFHLEENLRGRWAWNRWRSAREAAGQTYDPVAFAPGPMADSENFGADPMIAGAVTGRTGPDYAWLLPSTFIDVSTAGDYRLGRLPDTEAFKKELKGRSLEAFLQPFDARLDHLAEAARRPGCRFPVAYGGVDGPEMPQFLGMRSMARTLRLRATARLQGGHPGPALEDVLTGLRVSEHFQTEPHLISQLLRIAWTSILLQPVWEGLQSHAWNDEQLARLEKGLKALDLLQSMELAWHFERCEAVRLGLKEAEDHPERLFLNVQDPAAQPHGPARWVCRILLPRGWNYQNLLSEDRICEEKLLPVLDPAAHRVHPERLQALRDGGRRTPYHWRPFMNSPVLTSQNIRVARTQSYVDLARAACALERHRLARGSYPDTLAELAPAFLAPVPLDLVNGQPLRYARRGASYTLYSVGWNGVDEGGTLGQTPGSGGSLEPEKGDWVWFAGSPERP
jgi:hypothetical protein